MSTMNFNSIVSEGVAPNDVFARCYEFDAAADARARGIYPYFRPITENHGTRVVIEGRELIMAGSNNYLGLANDERVKRAAADAIARHGSSCSGSRFMNGSFDIHEELERRVAAFVGKESALCFTTGYQSNLGAISALMGPRVHIITDKFNHASIVDGIMLGSAFNRQSSVHRYKHNNMEDLERTLARLPEEDPKLIVTDGVFSMEGDIVDLPSVHAIARRYKARIYLDEAHSLGVVGPTGRGVLEHFGDPGLADLVMCTFSKSFGSIGGFVAGDHQVIDYIQHHARPLIFSASMPPAQVGAAMAALAIIESEPERVRRLQEIAERMIAGFTALGFNIGVAETPIVPLVIGDNERTFAFWKTMFEMGVYTNPVISPAVPPNRSLIRTSYMAIHSNDELDAILAVAAEAGRLTGVIPA